MLDEERVINRSSMCPAVCVGKVTCWVRLKVSRRVKNDKTDGDDDSSRCRLKSPMITNSEG